MSVSNQCRTSKNILLKIMPDSSKSNKKNSQSENPYKSMTAGDLDNKLLYQLWETYSALLRFMDAHSDSPLHKLSLTQWRTLNLIYFNPGSSQSALAKEVGITRASMSPIINYFEKKGLLQRVPGTRRNTFAISMTEKGKTEIMSFYKEIDMMEEGVNKNMRTEKYEQAINLLSELRTLFDNHNG